MGNTLSLDSPHFKHRLIRTLIQNTPVAYIIVDKAGRISFVNDYFLRFMRLEKEDILGEPCCSVTCGPEGGKCVAMEVVETGKPARMLRKDVLADGAVIYADDLAIPIFDEKSGSLEYVLEIMIDRTNEMLMRERNNGIFLEIINAMIKLLEKKDYYTCLHSRNVSALSAKLTRYMGLGERATFNAALGGLLHDLGKLYIPDKILNKPTKLDEKEYSVIKEHPMFTWLLLTGLNSFDTLREVAIAHHEKWDGSGYPSNVKGKDIPIEARITAIADAYDAMTTDRPYRKGLPHSVAIDEIKKFSGIQFDPEVVGTFIRMTEEYDGSRDLLVSFDKELSCSVADDIVQFSHQAQHCKPGGDSVHENSARLEEIMLSDSFIESIFNNTPAFYTVVDETLDVLYASENLFAATGKPFSELIGGKCFDVADRKTSCFKVEKGVMLCPVVRAFGTWEEQYSLMEEDLDGRQKLYFDNFAIPLELENSENEMTRCCMEIMFDRTREMNIQRRFEDDLKHLLEKIRNMFEEILPDVSANIREIHSEVSNFTDYLDNINTELSELVHTERADRLTGDAADRSMRGGR